MKNAKLLFALIFVMILTSLWAVSYEEYPIGCYSYLPNTNHSDVDPYSEADKSTLCSMMSNMGYNFINIESHIDTGLGDFLTTIRNNGLKAIVDDRYYYPFPFGDQPHISENYNHYSINALASSSYIRFEAEFADDETFGVDDKNWYHSGDEHDGHMPRVGAREHNTINDSWYWKCTRGSTNPGYAYTDIRWRWLNGSETFQRRFGGSEFRICNDHDIASKYVYINFHIKLSNFPAPVPDNSTVLFSIKTLGFGATDSVLVNHSYLIPHTDTTTNWTTNYCYGDYTSDYALGHDISGYFDFTVKINYADLLSLMIDDPIAPFWRRILKNLNPRILWNGICDLSIDYIEIEDQIHHDMMNPTPGNDYQIGVNARINYLTTTVANGDIIKYMYGSDEPGFGQFHTFKLIQQFINTASTPKLITAYSDQPFDKWQMPGAGTTRYYDHVKCFNDIAQPNIATPDIYPIIPEIDFNNQANAKFVQTTLDEQLLKRYNDTKQYCMLVTPHRPFIPVVQAFGTWRGTYWEYSVLPPYEMQKCMQYLPLCYGADGIIDYKACENLPTPPNNVAGQYCAIISTDTSDSTFTRIALKEANRKISVIGPKIKWMDWVNAGCLMTDSVPDELSGLISGIGLEDLRVNISGNGYYEGYVQCGLYQDSYDYNSKFVLVNRRTNRFIPSTTYTSTTVIPPNEYNTYYDTFEPQSVKFETNSLAHDLFGTYIAVYDSLSGDLFRPEGEVMNVAIDAGECRLVEMIGTLPIVVGSDYVLSNKAVLEGEVTINSGGHVSIDENTNIIIKKNTHINIANSASLCFRGNVTFGDNVTINVASGGWLGFENAECTWGQSSGIVSVGGEIAINGSHLDKATSVSNWVGIAATSLSEVTLVNSTISSALNFTVYDSDLNVNNCIFEVLPSSHGLILNNSDTGHYTYISNSQPDKGFYKIGTEVSTNYGIYLQGMANQVTIHNVVFDGFDVGIYKTSYFTTQDSIGYCNYVNCDTGIEIESSSYNGKIANCSFNSGTGMLFSACYPQIVDCDFEDNTYGISFTGSAPLITACSFISCARGVLMDYSTFTIMPNSGVISSNFTDCDKGIESRNSNLLIKQNDFYQNDTGILCHEDSNLKLSPGTKNILRNYQSNIEFIDSSPYSSSIQLYGGHNDFYHLEGVDGFDFTFDLNYYSNQINASKNWFQGLAYRVNAPIYQNNVYVGGYDPNPNTPLLDDSSRFFAAQEYESQGLYDQSIEIYKSMLDEQLPDEHTLLSSAADGVYRVSYVISDSSWSAPDYYATKVIQYSESDSSLCSLLKNYEAKIYVVNKEYQNAIDLIQMRIDDPINEVDSLYAVLDLEIVLKLAEMEESKKPISTVYTQYRYPNIQTFNQRHNEHWAELYKLLNKDFDEGIFIPTRPVITSNYPNPFNPSTTLTFSLPAKANARLFVYNLKGQKVKQLLNCECSKGANKVVWDGTDDNKKSVASGIYFIRLESGKQSNVRKVMLMK